ncbi:MAG: hypothetical protein WBE58_16450 [Verrucomicrobiales bacterium]
MNSIQPFHVWVATIAALVVVLGALISSIRWMMQRRSPHDSSIRQEVRIIKSGIEGLEIRELKSFFEQCKVSQRLTSSEVDYLLLGLLDNAARVVLKEIVGSISPSSVDASIAVGWLSLFSGDEKRGFLGQVLPAVKGRLGGNDVLKVVEAEPGGIFSFIKIIVIYRKIGKLNESDKAKILSKVPGGDRAKVITLLSEH